MFQGYFVSPDYCKMIPPAHQQRRVEKLKMLFSLGVWGSTWKDSIIFVPGQAPSTMLSQDEIARRFSLG